VVQRASEVAAVAVAPTWQPVAAVVARTWRPAAVEAAPAWQLAAEAAEPWPAWVQRVQTKAAQ
jgi:hypothetical protein